MKYKEFKKLPLNEMRAQLKKELSQILIYTSLVFAIGVFAILIFGWHFGVFIGLIVWLIVLLVIREKD